MINDPGREFIEKNQELSPKAVEHLITLYLNRVRREGESLECDIWGNIFYQ